MSNIQMLRKTDRIVEIMRSGNEEAIAKLTANMTDEELDILACNWDIWGRDEQLFYRRKGYFKYLVKAGRGWGKTRTISEAVNEWIDNGFSAIAICNSSPAAVRDINVIAPGSGIISCAPPWNKPEYRSSKATVVWPNGATAKMFSGANPEQSRGYNNEKCVLDELFAYKYPQETFDNLTLTCRIGKQPQILIPSTPKPTALMKRLMLSKDTLVVTGSTFDNKANLAPETLNSLLEMYGDTRVGRQELYGEVLDDNPDAVFNMRYIDGNRVTKNYFYGDADDGYAGVTVKIGIVSIDPSVTNNKGKSNETGIVVACLGTDGHVYILDDVSLQAEPSDWAKQAVRNFNIHKSHYIVYESNQGGLMVETIIHNINPLILMKPIFATKGKVSRAEPVSVLYEQGKVHHVGNFPILEQQMCEYETGMLSPDRLDALVHAVTHLLIAPKSKNIPIISSDPGKLGGNKFSLRGDTKFKGRDMKWPK